MKTDRNLSDAEIKNMLNNYGPDTDELDEMTVEDRTICFAYIMIDQMSDDDKIDFLADCEAWREGLINMIMYSDNAYRTIDISDLMRAITFILSFRN